MLVSSGELARDWWQSFLGQIAGVVVQASASAVQAVLESGLQAASLATSSLSPGRHATQEPQSLPANRLCLRFA